MSSITSAFVDVLAVAIGADAESLRTGTQITTASVLADLVSFAAVNTARTLVDISALGSVVSKFVSRIASLSVYALEGSDIVDTAVIGWTWGFPCAFVDIFAELI